MYHQHIVLFGQRHHAFEKIQLDTLRRRVGRKPQNHHFRLGDRAPNGFFQFGKEVDARDQRHRAYLGAGNHGAVNMNRIAGVWYQHGVTLIQSGQHQVRQTFLGTNGDDGFLFRVNFNVVSVGVPTRNRSPQARDAS